MNFFMGENAIRQTFLGFILASMGGMFSLKAMENVQNDNQEGNLSIVRQNLESFETVQTIDRSDLYLPKRIVLARTIPQQTEFSVDVWQNIITFTSPKFSHTKIILVSKAFYNYMQDSWEYGRSEHLKKFISINAEYLGLIDLKDIYRQVNMCILTMDDALRHLYEEEPTLEEQNKLKVRDGIKLKSIKLDL